MKNGSISWIVSPFATVASVLPIFFQELLASQTVSLLIFGEKRIAINVHERVDPALVFAIVLLLNCLFEGIFGKIQLITNICTFDGDVFRGLLGGPFRVGGFDVCRLLQLVMKQQDTRNIAITKVVKTTVSDLGSFSIGPSSP